MVSITFDMKREQSLGCIVQEVPNLIICKKIKFIHPVLWSSHYHIMFSNKVDEYLKLLKWLSISYGPLLAPLLIQFNVLTPSRLGFFWSQSLGAGGGGGGGLKRSPLHNFLIIQRIATQLDRISNWMVIYKLVP